jgi:hypothetical protein
MPPHKTWAKLFFWFYIVTMVPLLLFLFFLIFRALPRIIATAVEAFAEQARILPDAVSDANVLLAIATVLQMILLALPAIGATYMFLRLASKFLVGVWNWSKPTPQRRVAGALATTAFVALFAYLWVPQIPLPEAPGVGRPSSSSPPVLVGRFEPLRQGEDFTVQQAVRREPPPPEAIRQGGGNDEDAPGIAPEATPTPAVSVTPAATPATTPLITPVVTPAVATPIPTTAPVRPTVAPTVVPSPTPTVIGGAAVP